MGGAGLLVENLEHLIGQFEGRDDPQVQHLTDISAPTVRIGVMANWDDVARIVATLPETAEDSPRSWRVRKKLIAWERPLRKADLAALGDDAPDGDILGVRVPDEGVKFALIADDPGVYFTTPHFDGYPAVLVKLEEIDAGELAELVTEAWLAQAPKKLARQFLDG